MGWSTLRQMGHIDKLRERVGAGMVHGMIEGPVITFTDQDFETGAADPGL